MVPDTRKIILKIKNITVNYGPIIALKKINLEIHKGEIVALLGPNGSGKSTLLKSVVGLKKPVEGSIIYQEREIQSWNPETITRSGIQLIPEDGGIFKNLTVEENLQLGAYHYFHQYQRQYETVTQLFPLLKKRVKQIAGTLSGGEQRILSFARALMSPAQILMIDEPSLGLSPKYISQTFETIQTLNHRGYTILLAEQNTTQALKCVEKIYILESGQISLQGKVDEIKNQLGIREVYFGEVDDAGRQDI